MSPDAWAARWPLWDSYFALVGAGTAALVVAGSSVPAGAAALSLMAALAGWYVVFGRRLMRDEIEDRRGYVYLAVVLLLYVPAVAAAGEVTFALFALCPQAYMVMATVPATGFVIAFNATHLVLHAARTGDVAGTLTGPGPVALMVVVVSVVFGTWARHVSAQNEERARLIAQLDASRADVARLSHEAGVAAERQRLAGDLHDTVAQGLSSLVLLLQATRADLRRDPDLADRHLELAVRTAREHLSETRALVAALTPADLAASPLPAAVQRLAHRAGPAVTFETTGTAMPLPTADEVVLLRAAQEALGNAIRHAGAVSIGVTLAYRADTAVLEVRDDGAGFVPDAPTGGYGLSSMRARVAQAGGALTVESAPGGGTTIRVALPVRSRDEEAA
ncbi:sensor histidine kinase [Dactylosporangium fulvum]